MTMPVLKFKTLVNFPAQVQGQNGITVTKTAGVYTISNNYAAFTPVGPVPADASVVVYSTINNSYALSPITTIVGITEAPLDGKTYSRNNAIWLDAWASPVLTGNPTAPTATLGDNDTSVATTAFVQSAIGAIAVTGIPQNSKSAAYTTVLADQEKHIFHPSADTTARTWTIDSNANVAYPIGTAITFVNQNAAGVITIAITTDTMRLAGAGTTGNRTLAANGVCTALKVTATEWIISGTGLT